MQTFAVPRQPPALLVLHPTRGAMRDQRWELHHPDMMVANVVPTALAIRAPVNDRVIILLLVTTPIRLLTIYLSVLYSLEYLSTHDNNLGPALPSLFVSV